MTAEQKITVIGAYQVTDDVIQITTDFVGEESPEALLQPRVCMVIDLADIAIREALIDSGWTPPKGH